MPRAQNRVRAQTNTKTRQHPAPCLLQSPERPLEAGMGTPSFLQHHCRTSPGPVAKWQRWLLDTYIIWGPSTLREVGNLAFLGTQGSTGTNLPSPDPFDKRVLSWAIALSALPTRPATSEARVGHGEEAHQPLCLHLRSAFPKPSVDRQAGSWCLIQVPGPVLQHLPTLPPSPISVAS